MSTSAGPDRVLVHLSPHPDDEALGCPGVLLAMRDAGWRVVNFAVTMGRPEQHERRRREAEAAARQAGFELHTPDHPIGISASDDLVAGFDSTLGELSRLVDELRPSIVVAPSPHDAHHAHELVGRAIVSALEGTEDRPRLWLWGLWGDLPFPTIYAPFDTAIMDRAQQTLRCYAGEIARNDYATLLAGRAQANAILGAERVFGFGEQGRGTAKYADLLTECLPGEQNAWMLASPRVLDPEAEPAPSRPQQDVGWWLASTSPHDRRRAVALSARGARGSAG